MNATQQADGPACLPANDGYPPADGHARGETVTGTTDSARREVLDDCHEYRRPKRKPRSVDELHTVLLQRGHLTFTCELLVPALADDGGFVVEREADGFWAVVSVRRRRPRRKSG